MPFVNGVRITLAEWRAMNPPTPLNAVRPGTAPQDEPVAAAEKPKRTTKKAVAAAVKAATGADVETQPVFADFDAPTLEVDAVEDTEETE